MAFVHNTQSENAIRMAGIHRRSLNTGDSDKVARHPSLGPRAQGSLYGGSNQLKQTILWVSRPHKRLANRSVTVLEDAQTLLAGRNYWYIDVCSSLPLRRCSLDVNRQSRVESPPFWAFVEVLLVDQEILHGSTSRMSAVQRVIKVTATYQRTFYQCASDLRQAIFDTSKGNSRSDMSGFHLWHIVLTATYPISSHEALG